MGLRFYRSILLFMIPPGKIVVNLFALYLGIIIQFQFELEILYGISSDGIFGIFLSFIR